MYAKTLSICNKWGVLYTVIVVCLDIFSRTNFDEKPRRSSINSKLTDTTHEKIVLAPAFIKDQYRFVILIGDITQPRVVNGKGVQ